MNLYKNDGVIRANMKLVIFQNGTASGGGRPYFSNEWDVVQRFITLI